MLMMGPDMAGPVHQITGQETQPMKAVVQAKVPTVLRPGELDRKGVRYAPETTAKTMTSTAAVRIPSTRPHGRPR